MKQGRLADLPRAMSVLLRHGHGSGPPYDLWKLAFSRKLLHLQLMIELGLLPSVRGSVLCFFCCCFLPLFLGGGGDYFTLL